jgi:lipopolysaccharide export system protein LptA
MAIVKTTALLLLLLPCQLWALASDSEQPIEVLADELEVRDIEKISIYLGNVNVVQGSLEINADRVVIHFDQANELKLIEMTGRPATFRQLDDEQREILGEALQIDYNQSESLLELRESARIDYAGDIIESHRIRINTMTGSLQAGSAESDQRVKMVIQPKQNSTASE